MTLHTNGWTHTLDALATAAERFLHEETGQDLIEYALAAALLALAAIATMRNFGSVVTGMYTHISNSITSQT